MEAISRESGIGGTDIAAIVGLSPYRKPWDVYAEKRGIAEPFEVTPRMRLGKLLEPTVVKLYEEDTGKKVFWMDFTIRHPKLPFVIGTPDALMHDPADNALPGFEAKTAGLDQAWRWGEEQDDVPEEYLIQCQWYMLLTGRKQWILAALIGGDRFRYHVLDADEELQSNLLAHAEEFWQRHIVQGIQPDFDGSRSVKAYLRKMYPTATKVIRPPTGTELDAMRELANVNREYGYLKDRKEILTERLQAAIGNDYGLEAEGLKAIWYATKESNYTVHRPAGRTFKLTNKRRDDEPTD